MIHNASTRFSFTSMDLYYRTCTYLGNIKFNEAALMEGQDQVRMRGQSQIDPINTIPDMDFDQMLMALVTHGTF